MAQTFGDFNLFVLDNASDLDNKSIVDKFCDKRLQYVRYNENVGPEGNFARAINDYRLSKYLMVYHDDDVIDPHLLEREVEALESHCNLAFAGSPYKTFVGSHLNLENIENKGFDVMRSSADLAKTLLIDVRKLDFASVLYRSSRLNGVSVQDYWTRYGIMLDRPILFDLARNGGCALLKEPHTFRRMHPGQDSRSGRLTEQHIIELYLSYRGALQQDWSTETQYLFFRHTGLLLPYFYFKWMMQDQRMPFLQFVRECKRHDVLRYTYMPLALLDAGKRLISKLSSKDV